MHSTSCLIFMPKTASRPVTAAQQSDPWIPLCAVEDLDLRSTLLSGQCFRWRCVPSPAPDTPETWIGVVERHVFALRVLLRASKAGSWVCASRVRCDGAFETPSSDDAALLSSYFALDENVHDLWQEWTTRKPKHALSRLLVSLSGPHARARARARAALDAKNVGTRPQQNAFLPIRILRQDATELIFSYLCSQNNHVRRIEAMIEFLCVRYGACLVPAKASPTGGALHAFPSVAELGAATEAQLRKAMFGYRASYIVATRAALAAAPSLVADIRNAADVNEARRLLMSLHGVGRKVCDCILLYAFDRFWGVVPVDTHIAQLVAENVPRVARLLTEGTRGKGAKSGTKQRRGAAVGNAKPKSDDGAGGSVAPTEKKFLMSAAAHDAIQEECREVFGRAAGWAQVLLFASRVSTAPLSVASAETVSEVVPKKRRRGE